MASGRIILITGTSSGVGYEAVKIFLEAQKPYHILAGARSLDKATNAVDSAHKECPNAKNTAEPLALDVSNDESIEKAFELVKTKYGRLDVLLNNAGATLDMEWAKGNMSLRDCFNKSYDVNVTGAHVTAYTFMPLLLKSSDPRLIFVAGLSQITLADTKDYFPTPPQPAGWPKKNEFDPLGYRCSKTALNMLTLDWNHKVKADGVKVWGVAPGFLATNLGGMKDKVMEMGGGHPREGAAIYKAVVEGERDHQVGKVINKDGLSAL